MGQDGSLVTVHDDRSSFYVSPGMPRSAHPPGSLCSAIPERNTNSRSSKPGWREVAKLHSQAGLNYREEVTCSSPVGQSCSSIRLSLGSALMTSSACNGHTCWVMAVSFPSALRNASNGYANLSRTLAGFRSGWRLKYPAGKPRRAPNRENLEAAKRIEKRNVDVGICCETKH